VSAERVRDELALIVAAPGMDASLRMLDESGLLSELMPELTALRGVAQSLPHHWDVWEHTLRALDMLECISSRIGLPQARPAPSFATAPGAVWQQFDGALGPLLPELRAHLATVLSDERPAWLALKWAMLFHDVAKPQTRSADPDGRIRFFGHEDIGADMVAARMRQLRFSADEARRAETIVRHHMRPHNLFSAVEGASRRATYRFFRDTGEAGVDVLLLALADALATDGPDLDPAQWAHRLDLTRAMLGEYFFQREDSVSPAPLITGHDVMSALGLEPGPQVGRLLEVVREAQAAGEVSTREEALALAKNVLRGE
jgi:putative nucleotidyltransferase with HDIG domain